MAKKLRKKTECLNCGIKIGDANFCPECGQINSDKQAPIKHFVQDVLGDYFTFDSKFFRTFIPLVKKPGFLTNEYVSGKRVSYVFPFRMYLFVSFLFFFSLALIGQFDASDYEDPENSKKRLEQVGGIIEKNQPEIAEVTKKEIVDGIDSLFYLRKKSSTIDVKFAGKDTADTWFEKYLEKKGRYMASLGQEGALLYLKELINQIPKVMFLLLPIFALLLKLIYVRKKIFYVNHLIFALHIHTVIFLFLILTVLLSYWYIILSVILGLIYYVYKAFRNVYQQSRIKTLFKLMLLSGMYFFVMMIGIVLLALLALISI